ncbi:MAG: 50S ribosomal protein L4 [bacterium]|nr:50S ribosomal protein L4 [bacterium]
MTAIPVYNLEGKEVRTIELPSGVFDLPMNADLISQVATIQRANRRQVIAHTKDRGDVSGGGKKPWRQKGTGRARHGSNRSPIWSGGGVTFGPTSDRVFSRSINRKMRRKALLLVLAEKARRGNIFFLESPSQERVKTKEWARAINLLPSKGQKSLMVLDSLNQGIIEASRNLSYMETIQAKDLNVLDLLRYPIVIMTPESVEVIQKTFLGNSSTK